VELEAAQRRLAEVEAELVAANARAAAAEARAAAAEARAAAAEARIVELEKEVASLLERLGRNSGNSNKPPSTDPPDVRGKRREKKGTKSGRKRGGQPGRKGSRRELVPPDQVDAVVDLFPSECEDCFRPLPKTPDASARRYQSTELPILRPHTTEYRQHGVVCPCCSYTTYGPYDQVPASPFGPRLSSVVAVLTGVYHLSRRGAGALLSDLLGVRVSLGAVSAIEARVAEAVKPVVEECWATVGDAPVKHTDGTSWFKAGILCSLWTIATASATVFKIVANGKKATLQGLFKTTIGILISDRATALNFWAMKRRQICFAHLLRKFVAFSERGGRAGTIGRELLDYVGILFAYWDEVKSGTRSRESFCDDMKPVRAAFEATLERAAASGLAHVAGACADILKHRDALWTFVDHVDVDPTNNHAERELRAFVLWRKRSHGTQSDRGDVFAERLMTVAHTARKQGKNVLAIVTACCIAAREGTAAPSLFTPAR